MFLKKLLPSEGLYCVALLLPNGGFRHFFHDNLSAAQKRLDALDASNHTSYIAQATFDPAKITEAQAHNRGLPAGLSKIEWRAQAAKVRGQKNALFIKNFFLDIDCGEKWPVKNQHEGVAALKQFIIDTDLPFPAVVNSGNGLYAHWILTEAIPADKWKTIALLLKKVVASYSPKIGGDASRTADSASVLRTIGSTNRKPGRPEKKVTLLKDSDPILFMEFVRTLSNAAKKAKIDRSATLPPKKSTDLNAEFFVGLEQKHTPSDANQVADKCAQLALMREWNGDISHPLWFFCVGVLVHCKNGTEIIYDWTSKHPTRNSAKTAAVVAQWESSEMGPSTCVSIGDTNPEGCVGCPHKGKVKSPIVLGRPEPKQKELPEEQSSTPDGYRRADGGLYAEEDGRWVKFYDQDLYIDRLAYDESLGYEVMTIKHSLPHEGDMECTVRSSLVNDPKSLLTILADNHIKVVGMKEKKYMVGYLESHQARLQRNRRMTLLLSQMGWKEARNGDPMFVLGRKIFHKNGDTDDASLARNVPRSAEAYHTKGSLEKWSQATEILDTPGLEPFAFALLAGGFGAPLMKFTGFDGALVSLTGASGAGKSLIQRFIQSVWGYHIDLIMLQDDTKNAMVKRLGVYGNLPLTIDEVTNIEGKELSNLVFRVTQGRDKVRLTKSAEEKQNINTWNTLAVTSSNSSLVDKLSSTKHDATAEINRVFEYPVMNHPAFEGDVTEKIYWTIHENYGHAGVAYAKWLVENIDKNKKALDKIRGMIDKKADMRGEERFWGAIASTAIWGGLIAKDLGLIRFNVNRIITWASDTILTMRGSKKELVGDAVSMLAQFIDAHAANRLTVTGSARAANKCTIIEFPRGSLVMRHEVDIHRLYISRAVIKKWIATGYGSYTKIKNDLIAVKALIDPNKRKVLGAGTHFKGAQQACWEINMKCARLGPDVAKLVHIAESLKQGAVQEKFLVGGNQNVKT